MSWASELAKWKAANPGGTTAEFAEAIRKAESGAASAAAEASTQESLGISQAGLDLAKEQFDYQRTRDLEKEQNIASAMKNVNSVFDGRDPIYGTLKSESFQLNQDRLSDLQDDASRNLNFSLARAGNVGGSVEIDKNKEMAERMGLGTANAEMFAQSQSDALRAQDEQLKGSLLGLASSGAIQGDIASNLSKQSTQGRNGTANFTPNINNTFANMNSNIGGAANRQRQPGGF